MALLNVLADTAGDINLGLVAIGAGLAIFSAGMSSIGEALIASRAIEQMGRNPEQQGKLQSTMILAIALDESCGIYALIIAILIIFVLGARA